MVAVRRAKKLLWKPAISHSTFEHGFGKIISRAFDRITFEDRFSYIGKVIQELKISPAEPILLKVESVATRA